MDHVRYDLERFELKPYFVLVVLGRLHQYLGDSVVEQFVDCVLTLVYFVASQERHVLEGKALVLLEGRVKEVLQLEAEFVAAIRQLNCFLDARNIRERLDTLCALREVVPRQLAREGRAQHRLRLLLILVRLHFLLLLLFVGPCLFHFIFLMLLDVDKLHLSVVVRFVEVLLVVRICDPDGGANYFEPLDRVGLQRFHLLFFVFPSARNLDLLFFQLLHFEFEVFPVLFVKGAIVEDGLLDDFGHVELLLFKYVLDLSGYYFILRHLSGHGFALALPRRYGQGAGTRTLLLPRRRLRGIRSLRERCIRQAAISAWLLLLTTGLHFKPKMFEI